MQTAATRTSLSSSRGRMVPRLVNRPRGPHSSSCVFVSCVSVRCLTMLTTTCQNGQHDWQLRTTRAKALLSNFSAWTPHMKRGAETHSTRAHKKKVINYTTAVFAIDADHVAMWTSASIFDSLLPRSSFTEFVVVRGLWNRFASRFLQHLWR